MEKLETPVIVIGAGPAGVATSIFLSKHKIAHVVIEKAVFPRDKACGDSCGGRTTYVINKANPNWLNEMKADPGQFNPIIGMTIVSPGGVSVDIPLSGTDSQEEINGFVVTRLVLDNFLFEKMSSPYCTVYQGAQISKIESTLSRISVVMTQKGNTYNIHSQVIVGADGDKSIVKKYFQNKGENEKASLVAIRGYYDGITGMKPNLIELQFLPEIPNGYLWIFPLPEGRANVGIGIPSHTVRKENINLRELMLKTIKNNPRLSERFANATITGKIQGWGLPVFEGFKQVSGDNYLLAGDAASFIDPFSGEGVGNALFSGMLAADAIKLAIEQKDYSAEFFKKTYDDVFYKHLGPELKNNATMQRIFTHHWFFNFFCRKVNKSPSLKNAVADMCTNTGLQHQFKKPSFYLKVLLNR